MFKPTQFMDGENIVIVDNIPYYSFNGVSYMEKVKNGLSLEYVFSLQDFVPIPDEEDFVKDESDIVTQNLELIYDYENKFDVYEKMECRTLLLPRKGKHLSTKKRKTRNTKKNSTKVKGYEDKLFDIEQNQPDLFDESQIEIDYDDVSDTCSEYSMNYYTDYFW